jgi:hypothetical protein
MKKKLLALSVLTAISSQANAFQFDTGDDWSIRWDNTVKFNVMARVEKADKQVYERANGFWLADNNTLSQDRSGLGLVSTRLDILSEMDVIWKDSFGFRVSGAGWYDPQYEEGENDFPGNRNWAWTSPSADVGDYNHAAEDLHYAGGELLDAFAFANFDIGDTAWGVRAGRHTIYWGNSLLTAGAVAGVGASMAPIDISKALAVPGSEAKELFMPSNKISGVVQLTDNLTLNAYYSLEWQRHRLPEQGTYFSPAPLSEDTEFIPFPPGVGGGPPTAAFVTGYEVYNDQSEDDEFGFNVQYYIEDWALETSFIYLNYTDKNIHTVLSGLDTGQFATLLAGAGNETAAGILGLWSSTCEPLGYDCPTPLGTPYGSSNALEVGSARWLFKEDLDLWAVSFAKEIAGISFGLELTYRPDTPVVAEIGASLFRLYNTPQWPEGTPLEGLPTGDDLAQFLFGAVEPRTSAIDGNFFGYDSDNFLGPVGDVYTVVFNGVGLLTDNGIWEGGSYIFEFTAQMLDECTDDCNLKDERIEENAVFTTMDLVFRPTWYQVWPGTDLTGIFTLFYPLTKEKAPFTFAGDQQGGSASIGAEFLIDQKWTVTGRYNARFGPVNAGLGGLLKDRDNISFTIKRTF